AVPEGLLGWSVGKLLFGLRVRLEGDVEPPGLARAFVRSLIWSALVQGPGVVVALLVPTTPEYLTLASTLTTTLCVGAAAVLLCTMQKSNGYSCLHDLLSRTRLVAVQQHERAARFPSRAESSKVAPVKEGVQIGSFTVLGEAWRQGDECVLRG